MVGLSGLITPSLDEMVFVAAEMERRGMDLPLLIGGATTSPVHTAVKIEPAYGRAPIIHVSDASRAVGVVSNLLSTANKAGFVDSIRTEYAEVTARHQRAEAAKDRLPLPKARANALRLDWNSYRPTTPKFTGPKVIDDWDLADLADYIDWTPFFQTWEMKGVYPKILDDPKQGDAARALFQDAQDMLKRIISEKWFTPRAVVGFWPANTVGDDIRLFTGRTRDTELATFHTLRQQHSKRAGRPNLALSDFVAPEGVPDHVGGFVVTAGPEEAEISARFDRANDNYARSWSRRWPTAWPRRWPRRCMPACAATIGAMRRKRPSRPKS